MTADCTALHLRPCRSGFSPTEARHTTQVVPVGLGPPPLLAGQARVQSLDPKPDLQADQQPKAAR